MPDLELADWRRRVAALYAAVRDEADPERAHAFWRATRDELYQTHPQSPPAKGADLAGRAATLIVDLNFLYHPSCRYNDRWQCPLAPPANVVAAPVRAGERL